MAKKALLVNYRWCSGCHSCEVACQVQNDLTPDQFGIKLNEIGPFLRTDGKWEYTYIPMLTGQCNLCGKRLAAGKLPSCVQVCQANCLQLLDADEAARIAAANPKMLMMTL
ncbi:MAG: hypothetical protein IJH08_10150 [Atopobiaceae bacterium]|nr:hypothetical protein [Atopobiaceae bacterium]